MAENTAQEKVELHKYLDPKVLSSITRLDIRARQVVEGFINGMHKSPFHGFSVEFATHREYVPGDDIKHIDWKVQAKTDRFYIKQYEEETNLKATFLLDASESMMFKNEEKGSLSKYEYAATCVASLAFMLQQQQDAPGLGIFDEDLIEYIPASGSPQQIKRMVHQMHVAQPKKKTSLEQVAHALADKISRRGMICLVSDLFVDIDGVIRALEHFRHFNHEVMVLHIMDKDELEFPYSNTTKFEGLEEMGDVTCEPRALREAYLKEVEDFCHEVKRKCVASKIDYKLISTGDYLDAALCSFLAARASVGGATNAKR